MIIVTVELVSAISPERSKPLARMDISNTGENKRRSGKHNYTVKLVNSRGIPYRFGIVRDHEAERLGVWNLVHKALEALNVRHGRRRARRVLLDLDSQRAVTLLAALQDPDVFGSWAGDIEKVRDQLRALLAD